MLKLPVDLTDEAGLRAVEKELVSLLDTVRYAIAKRNGSNKPPVTVTIQTPIKNREKLIPDFVDKLGKQFSSSDVYMFGDQAGFTRGEIRSALYALLTDNKIKIIHAGKARRATIYEKN